MCRVRASTGQKNETMPNFKIKELILSVIARKDANRSQKRGPATCRRESLVNREAIREVLGSTSFRVLKEGRTSVLSRSTSLVRY
jgi:hypothetical protein